MKRRSAFAAVLLACAGAHAQPTVKDGFPCVSELCVGDGLQELKGLQWEPLKPHEKAATAAELDTLGKSLRGSVTPAAVAAVAKTRFDGSSLEALGGITAACKSDMTYTTGFFTSNAGSRTQVTLGLLPGNGQSRWTVLHIRRFINAPNPEAAKELIRQLEERYAGLDKPLQRKPKTRGSFEATYSIGTSSIVYDLSYTTAEYNDFEKKTIPPVSCRAGLKAD